MPRLERGERTDVVAEIFHRYHRHMHRVANRIIGDIHLAEDIVSEAMIKVIRHVDLVDEVGSKKCANLIYTITKNTALDSYRKRKKELEKSVTNEDIGFVNSIEDHIDYDAFETKYGFGKHIREYIKRLTPVEVDVIGLRYGDGFSYREIGEVLGMSEDAARKKASRARKKIKIMIRKESLDKWRTWTDK
jgi:RNA polymerase sigma-70 factor (ECF subfamily)